MEDNDILALPGSSKGPMQTLPALKKTRTATTPSIISLERPHFFKRLLTSFLRLLYRASGPRETQATGFACTAQAKAPLVFKGGASVTMANPLGTYAGKPACDPRRLAEQQFHRLDSSHGATIN